MTLREIYLKAIEAGKSVDWRGEACIERILTAAKRESSAPGFDQDRLFNPYGDTRMVYGDPDTEIRSVLVGIEIHSTHLLLADAMRRAGKQVDLALSHHVSCINRGLYYFDDILLTHEYNLAEVGVPKEKYEPAVREWISDVKYEWRMDTTNTAQNLGIPLMNIHTPCDLFHVKRLRDTLARMQDASLGEIAEDMNRSKEISSTPCEAVRVHGDDSARAGKVYSPIGAGWTAKLSMFEMACDAGIDTAVFVWPPADYLQMAKDRGVNILEIPHNSNDNYGINMMLDAIQELGPLTIYDAHDFVRVERR